jgi:hypothetical protein
MENYGETRVAVEVASGGVEEKERPYWRLNPSGEGGCGFSDTCKSSSQPGGGVEKKRTNVLVEPPRKKSTSTGAVTGTLEGAEAHVQAKTIGWILG